MQAPSTRARYLAFVRRFGGLAAGDPLAATHVGLLVCRCEDDAIVGAFNIGEIVRGLFQSAYLGYYAFAPHAGAGYMSEGLELVLHVAFRVLKLHRVEANVQPTNRRSLALVRRAGFVREGYSRRYVRIAGRWRDHVRMALLVEDWRARRKTSAPMRSGASALRRGARALRLHRAVHHGRRAESRARAAAASLPDARGMRQARAGRPRRVSDSRAPSRSTFNLHYHEGNAVVMPVVREQSREDAGVYAAQIAQDYCLMWEAGPAGATIDYRIRVKPRDS